MGYDEQAQGDKPLLSIVEAVILEGDTRPAKHRSASLKSRPCLAKLLPFFASSRSYLTLYGSSFCSYMHEKASSHGQTGSELPIRSVRAESQVRSMGRPARGVRGMDLDAGDYLVGMEIVEEEDSFYPSPRTASASAPSWPITVCNRAAARASSI